MSRFRSQNGDPHLINVYILKGKLQLQIAAASRNILIGITVMDIVQSVYDSFSGAYFCLHQGYFNEKRLKDEIVLDLVINYMN